MHLIDVNFDNIGTNYMLANINGYETLLTKFGRCKYLADNNYAVVKFRGQYEWEHRVVVYEDTGEWPSTGSVVHHKNGCKVDNRIENLQVCISQEEHHAIHESCLEEHGTWHPPGLVDKPKTITNGMWCCYLAREEQLKKDRKFFYVKI